MLNLDDDDGAISLFKGEDLRRQLLWDMDNEVFFEPEVPAFVIAAEDGEPGGLAQAGQRGYGSRGHSFSFA